MLVLSAPAFADSMTVGRLMSCPEVFMSCKSYTKEQLKVANALTKSGVIQADFIIENTGKARLYKIHVDGFLHKKVFMDSGEERTVTLVVQSVDDKPSRQVEKHSVRFSSEDGKVPAIEKNVFLIWDDGK